MYHSYEQYQEHMDHEFGSHYDDHRERYSAEIQEAQNEYELQQWYDEYMTKVYEAGFMMIQKHTKHLGKEPF